MTMKTTELHPEGLLDQAVSGELTRTSESVLAEHLRTCRGCDVHLELARNAQPQERDDALLARVVDSAVRTATTTPELAIDPAKRHPTRWIAWLAAAAVMLTAAVSLGTVWYRSRHGGGEAPSPEVNASQEAPPPAVAASPHPSPPESTVDFKAIPVPTATPLASGARPRETPSSSQDLLTAADAARRDGNDFEAVKLYRALQRQFPQSVESVTSRVILGRLLLLKLKNPSGALGEFDAYLRGAPRGSMVEEALVGRASALDNLGRATEEREAWRMILDRFPTSVHAERARARLHALDGSQGH